MVSATHIILVGYGHWLPNDIRGSLSIKTLSPELRTLAENHYGMKLVQPSQNELSEFFERSAPALSHERLWFDEPHRRVIVDALAAAFARHRLCIYACAVLTNHVHLLVQRHAIRGQDMPPILKKAARAELLQAGLVSGNHPVFSESRNHFFKSSPEAVRDCVDYIYGNFAKHGLPPESYPFITPYGGEYGAIY